MALFAQTETPKFPVPPYSPLKKVELVVQFFLLAVLEGLTVELFFFSYPVGRVDG